MKTILLFFALLTGVIAGCKKSPDLKESPATTAEENRDNAVPIHDHSAHVTSVTLNDGQKWAANAETTAGIQNIINHLQTFPQNPAVEDYGILKTKLEQEFDTILQKCTMTGEAHNQLHNYLLPMKTFIDKLGADSIEASQAAVISLRQYLSEYADYFE